MAVTSSNSLWFVRDAGNNTAIVKYEVYATTSGSSHNDYGVTTSVNVDGQQASNWHTLPYNSNITCYSGEFVVGNASGRTINASYSIPTGISAGTLTGSASVTIPSLVSAPTINTLQVTSRTLNSITCSFTCSKSNNWYYRKGGSGNWTQGSSTNVTSGSFTISGLQPNETTSIQLLCRNWSGSTGLDTTKSINGTTYDIGKISSANNFIHGNNAFVSITNPSGNALSLALSIGNTAIKNLVPTTGNNSISFTDDELDKIYKLYGQGNTLTITYTLKTNSYTNTKTATITFNGNQKTIRRNNQGNWKRGKLFYKNSNTWKKAVVWYNNNGTWKRGI